MVDKYNFIFKLNTRLLTWKSYWLFSVEQWDEFGLNLRPIIEVNF